MEEDELEGTESTGPDTKHKSAAMHHVQSSEIPKKAHPHAPSVLLRKLDSAIPTLTPSPEPEIIRALPTQPLADAQELEASSEPSSLFFVDLVGEKTAASKANRPVIRSRSPASPESDDEIVFHGRGPTHARVVDDPVLPVPEEEPVHSTTTDITPNGNSWDDTSVDWVHRSKPGIGWSIPRVKKKVAPPQDLLAFRVPEEENEDEDEDTSAADDYLRNVQENEPEFLQAISFAKRDIDIDLGHGDHVHEQFQSLSVSSPRKGKKVYNESFVSREEVEEVEDMEESGSAITEDEEEEDFDTDDLSDTDSEIYNEDDISAVVQGLGAGTMDDESLAFLLSEQEALGLGSDELLIYNDSVETSVAHAAKRYAKDTPKKSRRVAKDYFPSATLLADALDQDPYGGFDVMDYERPSLRKKKGKKSLPFEVSDDDLKEDNEAVWDNDRSKKKARKQEREELRMQGLLGSKSIVNKYGEGMTIMEIGKEFESFLGSEAEEKSFPPMDKRRRKMIHEIAADFNLKTKSIGAGNNRYTKVIKTRTTTRWMENKFAARARKMNLGFFPRTDSTAKGKKVLRVASRAGGGGNSAGVRYRDGDIVGGAAPEIGVENRGRAMLEKMGWTSGMGLGTLDNKGILTPITHVVKNTKTGLG